MKSPYLLAIVSGILIGTSYIPFPPWAIFFCFVPLWFAWLRASKWSEIFWTGWVAQFVLTLIGFNWVSHTLHEFGHLPWVASIALLLAFAGICTLSIPIAGVVWWWYARQFRLQGAARIWALVAWQAVGERVFPMIFDWHFGYTWLWAGLPGLHLADIIGFIGLSNIGLLFNGLFLHAYLLLREGRTWWPWAAAPVAAFMFINLAGRYHGQALPQPDKNLRILIAQANIGNEEKLIAEQGWAFRDTVIGKFMKLTEEGIRGAEAPVDFVVWPETAFPEFINSPTLDTGYSVKLREKVKRLGTKLITGGYSHLEGSDKATNSFFVIGENGEWLAKPYHKTILLAFGEYFPGAELLPKLRQWFPEVADFGRGPGPTVLEARDLKIGAQICYEGLFDWFTRELANKGARIIVNITNDSWYGTWQEPYQHGYMTLARAVEVRRPLVRSTNTGISTVVLASGRVLELSPLHKEWKRLYEVPYVSDPPPTLFMRWGYWILPALIGAVLALLPPLAFRREQL